MTRRWQISRRTVLRGLGTAVALPWLEAMAPAADLAGGRRPARRRSGWPSSTSPTASTWRPGRPTKEGADFELPYILEPLKAFKDDLLVLTGLAQDGGAALGDGGGDHARSLASFLTGVHPLKTDGATSARGSRSTRSPPRRSASSRGSPRWSWASTAGRRSGDCDTGYSCAYSSNISWRSPTTPMAKEVNPRLVFDRLFASRRPRTSRPRPAPSATSTARASSTSSPRTPSSSGAGSARTTAASSTST